MTYLLMIFVLLLYGFLDSAQDKLNSHRYKRPNHRLPWPLIDTWHGIKRVRLYLPVVYILAIWRWPGLVPPFKGELQYWLAIVGLALMGSLMWRIIPRPKHWT